MTMIDMKFTKSEKKDEAKEYAVGPGGQPADYPWGLCIRLESEELKKGPMGGLREMGAGRAASHRD